MSSRLSNLVRIEQTRRGIAGLRAEAEQWIAYRQKKDHLGQYHTQLKLLGGVLANALERLAAEAEGISGERAAGSVYAECRRCERRTVWLRRVWEYFRRKFDQRDDAALGPVLAAADEVVWSCWAGVFRQADLPVPPAPLAYLEPMYSPQAMPRSDPPPDLRSDVDADFLLKCLQQLPIPLVALPPACVMDPWWLVYVGHEVGHHVQYELRPDWQLVTEFGARLEEAALAAPEPCSDEDGAARWRQWGQEIFADLFSLHLLGGAALAAMGELERAEPAEMLKARRGAKSAYPAAVVRLALMAEIGRRLGIAAEPLADFAVVVGDGPPVMEGGRDLRAGAAVDLTFIPKLAGAAVDVRPDGHRTMAQLCDWDPTDFAPGGAVQDWAESLREGRTYLAEKSARAARLVIAGGVAAWQEVAVIEEADRRAEERERLRTNLLAFIPKTREEGTRAAAATAAVSTEKLGGALVDLIPEATG